MSIFQGTRKWIYARKVRGRFQRWHRWTGRVLVGILFAAPWIKIGGLPLVLIDLPARRLHLLGRIFTASDGYMIAIMGLLAAFLLFFVSAAYGRLWCGYLCPQTVFLEEWVRRVEEWIEGSAVVRRRRDEAPPTVEWALRKTAKMAALLVLAVALSGTVLSYFTGAWTLWSGQASAIAYSLVAVGVAAWMFNWVWFREQFCIYLCPYARFQSALTDEHSLTVGFDASVDIQRGKESGLSGNCVDCKKCVAVCPMGIDIRDGFQLECIHCARCVDACAGVMEHFEQPSLVRYTTIAQESGGKSQLLRGRTLLYGAISAALSLALVWGLVGHDPVEVQVHRSPGSLYQVDEDGFIRNTFLLRVVNNDPREARDFDIALEGLEGAELIVPLLSLAQGEDRTVPLIVRAPVHNLSATQAVRITLTTDGRSRSMDTTFKGPNG